MENKTLIKQALKELNAELLPGGKCPDEETLARFAEGTMDEKEAGTIEEHLVSCPQCCEYAVSLNRVHHFPEGERLPDLPERELELAKSLVQEKAPAAHEMSITDRATQAIQFIKECFTFEWVAQPLPVAVRSGALAILMLLVGSTVFFYYQQGAMVNEEGKRVPLMVQMEIQGKTAELTTRGIPQEETRVIRAGDTLFSNEYLRIAFEVDRDAYAYVVLHDSKGELTQLYPDPAEELAEKVKGGTRLTIPAEGAEWFQLDDARGKESVLVIASHEPLYNLKGALKSLEGKSEAEIVEQFEDNAAVQVLSFNHR